MSMGWDFDEAGSHGRVDIAKEPCFAGSRLGREDVVRGDIRAGRISQASGMMDDR